MLRDITVGQYYPSNSVIHQLDPRLKILGTFLYILMLFICGDLISYAISATFLAILIFLAKIPLRYIFRGLRAIFFVLLLSVGLNLFFTEGRVIFRFYFLKITYEGLMKTLILGIRLVFIIIASSLLTLTTTPTNLTDGLERSLHFLHYIKVPVHDIAMMMSIALRFIPILMEETNKIMKAQTARGADFETGGIVRRVRAMIPILVPLFISAFRRANDLAVAMDARCYRGEAGRTKMRPLKYSGKDYGGYLVLILFLGILIMMKTMY